MCGDAWFHLCDAIVKYRYHKTEIVFRKIKMWTHKVKNWTNSIGGQNKNLSSIVSLPLLFTFVYTGFRTKVSTLRSVNASLARFRPRFINVADNDGDAVAIKADRTRRVKRMSRHRTFLIDTDLETVPSSFVVLLEVFLAARRKETREPSQDIASYYRVVLHFKWLHYGDTGERIERRTVCTMWPVSRHGGCGCSGKRVEKSQATVRGSQ